MNPPSEFENRAAAGQFMAEALRRRGTPLDCILAIPRGGVPVGKPMAEKLKIPLDVTVSRKIGAPTNPEFAIAAVALDGTEVFHPTFRRGEIPSGYFEREKREAMLEIRRRLKRYRGEEREREVRGLRICLVDDGVATGLTMLCALKSAKRRGAVYLMTAAPVGSRESQRRFLRVADEVLFLKMPEPFFAVGQFYADFRQLDDEEVCQLLSRN